MRPAVPSQHISNKGFALIEVLTTILVVSFGLIGLAGLGVVGLKNNHVSYMRSIATQQAYDMADRMRANLGDTTTGGVKGGSYNSISGLGSDPGCIANAAGCSYANLALYDQYAWNTANAALLPTGAGTVTGTPSTFFTVTVSWIEKCTASVNGSVGEAGCGSDGSITQSFAVTFVP